MKKPIVKIENVVKIFNKRLWALRGINLELFNGDVVGLIGSKNSGKGVLSRLIANEIAPSIGSVSYGFDLSNKANIGYQFRSKNWLFGLKVKDLINLYKESYKIYDEHWLEKLYSVFNIKNDWNAYLTNADFLWCQTFNLFLALISKPKVLVIDSIPVTIGVDIKNKIIEFLKTYINENECCVVIIAPDELMFKELCTRSILMNNGLIIRDEYVANSKKDVVYDKYLIEAMEYVEFNQDEIEISKKYKHLVSVCKKEKLNYHHEYEKYISIIINDVNFKDKKISKLLKLIGLWSSIINKIYEKVILIASHNENKYNIKDLKKYINEFKKIYKKTIYIYKKNNCDCDIKKNVDVFFENTKGIYNFVNNDLKSLINIEYNEIESLDSKESIKLKKMKKKFISDEIRAAKSFYFKNKNEIKDNDETN